MRAALVSLVLGVLPNATWARACDASLGAGVRDEVIVYDVDFVGGARREVSKAAFKMPSLRAFVSRRGLTVIRPPGVDAHALIFKRNFRQRDVGYVLRGDRVGGTLRVRSLVKATPVEEREYFKAVAKLHSVKERHVRVKRLILDCANLAIRAPEMVKLWLKHRVTFDDVATLLSQTNRSPRVTRPPYENRQRYEIEDHLADGRHLRVVVQEEDDCPSQVISAYEIP